MMKHTRLAAMVVTIVTAITAGPALAGKAILNLVLVVDGLRPDSITAQETPNLWRLREEGVNFPNGHAVFPTVTRANAAAIGTGVYPDRNGIFGNSLYVRQVDPNRMGEMIELPFGTFPLAQCCGFPPFDVMHHHGQIAYIQTLLGDGEDHFDMG